MRRSAPPIINGHPLAIGLAGLFVLVAWLAYASASKAAPAPPSGQARPAAPALGCGPDWSVVDSPYVADATNSQISAVAAMPAR